MSNVFGASKPSPIFGPKGAGNNGNSEGQSVIQAYFPGGRLSETIRGWQARAGQRSVVQARGADKGHAFPTPPGFLKNRAQGSGQPLQAMVKSQMESFFQTDFSNVRVHVGPEAPSIGALAFTVGTNLYFAPGQYQPNTPGGRHLIGHELTHVVQQAQGRVENPYGRGLAVVHDPRLEEEAEQQGMLAAKHPGRGKPATRQGLNRPYGDCVRESQAGSRGPWRDGSSNEQIMGMPGSTLNNRGEAKGEGQHLIQGSRVGGRPQPPQFLRRGAGQHKSVFYSSLASSGRVPTVAQPKSYKDILLDDKNALSNKVSYKKTQANYPPERA